MHASRERAATRVMKHAARARASTDASPGAARSSCASDSTLNSVKLPSTSSSSAYALRGVWCLKSSRRFGGAWCVPTSTEHRAPKGSAMASRDARHDHLDHGRHPVPPSPACAPCVGTAGQGTRRARGRGDGGRRVSANDGGPPGARVSLPSWRPRAPSTAHEVWALTSGPHVGDLRTNTREFPDMIVKQALQTVRTAHRQGRRSSSRQGALATPSWTRRAGQVRRRLVALGSGPGARPLACAHTRVARPAAAFVTKASPSSLLA